MLEIDLQLSADNHLILLHDEELDRTTNGKGLAKNLTLAELKQLDAAYPYPELRGTGISIPTFREFLDEFSEYPTLIVMLDIKDIDCIQPALELVKEYGIEDRIIFGAVPTDSNALLQKLKPPTVPLITDTVSAIAIITAYYFGALPWYTFSHNVFGFILSEYTSMFWSKGLVDAVHAAGCKVLVCGDHLNDPLFQRQCIEFGVDFILSDRPDLLRETMKITYEQKLLVQSSSTTTSVTVEKQTVVVAQ